MIQRPWGPASTVTRRNEAISAQATTARKKRSRAQELTLALLRAVSVHLAVLASSSVGVTLVDEALRMSRDPHINKGNALSQCCG
ncbi:hypothetical protein PybrP1_000298 [[Pythium] brassicae (nom. inval.)]|nr:hypothetical protein PybrP1_000298 [[Pythium] brassicae (nom. inval.)]